MCDKMAISAYILKIVEKDPYLRLQMRANMATNVPSCFSIQFLEQLLKFLVKFTLLKYVKSQRNYGF